MTLIQELSQVPIIQYAIAIIIIYLTIISISVVKAWLRVWKVKAIETEFNITKKDEKLKELVIERLGQSSLSKSIENNLNRGDKHNEKEKKF